MRTVLAVVLLAAAGGPNLQPGQWEITVDTEVRAAAGAKSLPPQVLSRCLTDADVGDIRRILPGGADCRIVTGGFDGATYAYVLSCDGGAAHLAGTMTFGGDTYEAFATLRTNDNQTTTVLTGMRGRRVGAC